MPSSNDNKDGVDEIHQGSHGPFVIPLPFPFRLQQLVLSHPAQNERISIFFFAHRTREDVWLHNKQNVLMYGMQQCLLHEQKNIAVCAYFFICLALVLHIENVLIRIVYRKNHRTSLFCGMLVYCTYMDVCDLSQHCCSLAYHFLVGCCTVADVHAIPLLSVNCLPFSDCIGTISWPGLFPYAYPSLCMTLNVCVLALSRQTF